MTHQKKVDVLGVSIDPANMEQATEAIRQLLDQGQKGYICMVGVHGVMEAQRDPDLAAIYDAATLMLPDGMPTVWVGHWQGFGEMRRVTGPDLMLEIFRRPEFSGVRHYLYGGKAGIAEELKQALTRRFPHAQIVGHYTPPFRDLNVQEWESLRSEIQGLKPDIIWVGISTPRQEKFMYHALAGLDATLMFGVGAAFDYHTGRIKDAPEWVKTIGMQWLHRLIQDPRRLMARYLRNNPAFVGKIILQLLRGTSPEIQPPSIVEQREYKLAVKTVKQSRR
ncbi:WecB/TagA/CpsF family glycosyltransferase [Terriglobus sp. 2YAB30_2]|uniref:WecB/TagA/CpsF family glycosyltransferase n=1 Tax=unclassified Terriglobus TaxID=2628988 RepID=UPI003F97F0BC